MIGHSIAAVSAVVANMVRGVGNGDSVKSGGERAMIVVTDEDMGDIVQGSRIRLSAVVENDGLDW